MGKHCLLCQRAIRARRMREGFVWCNIAESRFKQRQREHFPSLFRFSLPDPKIHSVLEGTLYRHATALGDLGRSRRYCPAGGSARALIHRIWTRPRTPLWSLAQWGQGIRFPQSTAKGNDHAEANVRAVFARKRLAKCLAELRT